MAAEVHDVIEVAVPSIGVVEAIMFVQPVIEVSIGRGEGPEPQDPPEIEWGTPPGTLLTADTPISVKLKGTDLVLVILSVAFVGPDRTEVIFRSGDFSTEYASSTVTQIGDEWIFSIKREGGWVGTGLRLFVDVVDSAGQVPSD